MLTFRFSTNKLVHINVHTKFKQNSNSIDFPILTDFFFFLKRNLLMNFSFNSHFNKYQDLWKSNKNFPINQYIVVLNLFFHRICYNFSFASLNLCLQNRNCRVISFELWSNLLFFSSLRNQTWSELMIMMAICDNG